MPDLTERQREVIDLLRQSPGQSAHLDRRGKAILCGETVRTTGSTWLCLIAAGVVELDVENRRLRLTKAGLEGGHG